jgi:hypothetical protein
MTAADVRNGATPVGPRPAETRSATPGCTTRLNGKPRPVGRDVRPARGAVSGLALRAREP